MQTQYVVASFLNEACTPAMPTVQIYEGEVSPGEVREMLADMHSKGTPFSCAVQTMDLRLLIDEKNFEVFLGQLAVAKSLGDEALDRFRRSVEGLLTAGAQVALQIPGIETSLPQSR